MLFSRFLDFSLRRLMGAALKKASFFELHHFSDFSAIVFLDLLHRFLIIFAFFFIVSQSLFIGSPSLLNVLRSLACCLFFQMHAHIVQISVAYFWLCFVVFESVLRSYFSLVLSPVIS